MNQGACNVQAEAHQPQNHEYHHNRPQHGPTFLNPVLLSRQYLVRQFRPSPPAVDRASGLDGAAAAQPVHDAHYQRGHRQQVNQSASDVQAEAQQPKNEVVQRRRSRASECPLNSSSFVLGIVLGGCSFLLRGLPLRGLAAKRFSAFQAMALRAGRDQPTERAHPLRSNLPGLRFHDSE
jgi:hypothetical protein